MIQSIKIRFPFLFFLFSQLISLIVLKTFINLSGVNFSGITFLIFHLIFSTAISQLIFKLPKWFFYISILLPLLIFLSLNFTQIDSKIYGVAFVVLALTFSHTLKERVPLYLSNQTTSNALIDTMKMYQLHSFIDLGSGTGKVVRAISEAGFNSFGAETAPSLFFFSTLLSWRKGKILNKSIWDINLGEYDCVYTFLSPAVMDRIGEKFQNEMKKGTLLISNSFPIENIPASKVISLADQRKTKLYLYFKN